MSDRFKRLELRDWRQFQQVDIDFHEHLTVITGANGAGKTTLLNILGKHFGWDIALIATARLSKQGVAKYYSGWESKSKLESETENSVHEIGKLTYSDDLEAILSVPEEVSQSFNVQLQGQQPVSGVFLPSHRPVYSYRQVDQIPTIINAREQLFDQFYSNMRGMYQPESRYDSPSYRLKSALISLATFGYGNQAVEKNQEAISTFEGFQAILKKVLPNRLGFQRISIRLPEVVLECDSGSFSLDAASGGVAAIIDVCWQLYMKSLVTPAFVAVFDEPENHLHPELQRTIMPGLIDAFPHLQFIVATHNPFIVTSVRDSTVIVLNYVDNRVVSSRLDEVDRSASANQVLTDVLGLPAPIPIWVQNRIDEIMEGISGKEFTKEALASLRSDLDSSGLATLFPEILERLVEEKK